jgi:hypothetical protein
MRIRHNRIQRGMKMVNLPLTKPIIRIIDLEPLDSGTF